MKRSPRALALGLAALVVLLAIDLASKEWALEALSTVQPNPPPLCQSTEHGTSPQRLRSSPVTIVSGYFELRYAENCGAAFGFLRRSSQALRTGVFGIAAVAAICVLCWMFVRGKGGALFAWSVPLVASGAIGNLVDRIRHGFVVDFIRLHLAESRWEWPTFNIADAAITIGVALLVIDGFKKRPEEAAKRDAGSKAKVSGKASSTKA